MFFLAAALLTGGLRAAIASEAISDGGAPVRTTERAAAEIDPVSTPPFGDTARFGSGWYVSIPHHPDLNPQNAITVEAWVQILGDTSGCPSIAGKGYSSTWWFGICNNQLRSFLNNVSHTTDVAHSLDNDVWHHVALTWENGVRKHYLDGELVSQAALAGPLDSNGSEMRIGKDVDWNNVADMRVDEVRLWNRALNEWEIGQRLLFAIREQEPGLVGVWSFDNSASCTTLSRDEVGSHDGNGVGGGCVYHVSGNPVATAANLPGGPWLTTNELPGFQFKVRITSGDGVRIGTKVNDCVPETLCVAGAIPSRSELFLRIIGPRPNNMMWAQGPRFTISQVEVWIEEIATGELNYYLMEAVSQDEGEISGFNDRFAFYPD